MTIEQEINEAVKKLSGISGSLVKHRQRIMALGGAYASAAIESAAPKSKKPHYRYSTKKVVKSIRAPKGKGSVVATYMPGNLGRSVNVLKFARAKSKVFVGAKVARSSKGVFAGRRTDGYYLHMVEDGTKNSSASPFFRSAWERSKSRVFSIIKKEFERVGRIYESENKIK